MKDTIFSLVIIFSLFVGINTCFPHATYHLHATSHPHFTIFVFSTHKNSKNIKTGWKDNKVKLQLRLLFLCFRGRKLEVWNEKKIGRLLAAAKIINVQVGVFTELRYGIILILSPGDHAGTYLSMHSFILVYRWSG